jgi:hypothetical protein
MELGRLLTVRRPHPQGPLAGQQHRLLARQRQPAQGSSTQRDPDRGGTGSAGVGLGRPLPQANPDNMQGGISVSQRRQPLGWPVIDFVWATGYEAPSVTSTRPDVRA